VDLIRGVSPVASVLGLHASAFGTRKMARSRGRKAISLIRMAFDSSEGNRGRTLQLRRIPGSVLPFAPIEREKAVLSLHSPANQLSARRAARRERIRSIWPEHLAARVVRNVAALMCERRLVNALRLFPHLSPRNGSIQPGSMWFQHVPFWGIVIGFLERLTGRKKTLLVLEEDPWVKEVLRQILTQYTLLEASNAEEAVQLFNRHKRQCDLLVADVILPTNSGIEVALILRLVRSDLPVILISAKPVDSWSGRDSVDAKSLGQVSVRILPKPFWAERLVKAVGELV
jgi:CheY-like chemotaxis protein